MITKVIAVLVGIAIGGTAGWFGGDHYRELREDLALAQEAAFKFARERDELQRSAKVFLAAKDLADADINALMTPVHKEALKMWSQFPEVCRLQTLGDLMQGDYGCAVQALPAAQKGESFPRGALRAQVLMDPEKAMARGKDFLRDRCARIQSFRPSVCWDYGYGSRS